MLRELLCHKYPELEIKSVDGFQGREKEAVVLSFVRSNRKGEVGFLAEDRRINVAFTRARRHVAVICDSRTTGNHCFLKRLVNYMSEHGEVRTAFEYLDDIVPENYAPQNSQSFSSEGKKYKCNRAVAPKGDREKRQRKSAKQPEERLTEGSVPNTARITTGGSEGKEHLSKHKARILEFLDSSETQLDFPPSLNAHDRLLIHQLAEEYGLQHISLGEGKERYISIRRKTAATNVSIGDVKACEQELSPKDPSPLREISGHTEERVSSASPGKVDLKTLHMERMQREKARREEREKQNPQRNVNLQEITGKKHKNDIKGKPSIKTRTESVPEEDFDAMISAAIKADNTCGFFKCKASITTLGQLCLHCNKRYCLSHLIPEIHGCGEKAKAHARQRISREGILYPGSGSKDKSLDPTKRAHLQRRLDKKLSELTSQRKSKKKEK
ncbi:DNA-binding protein SMUBP-2-like [Sceloporus undulatus]|uniref:DNA-binding protein SMUBP-2-like n=1 Tax=Sceloporus undulatus TaxID=8520 RepID=UPI001C4BFEF9|nr:DNA-binding protein SMUBP-2-like [Sceloporus undulatus]